MQMSATAEALPWDEGIWTWGDRLAKARRLAGLTQTEMAVQVAGRMDKSVSKQTISNWENDLNQPRELRTLMRHWSEITGAPLSFLLGMSTSGYIADRPDLALVPAEAGQLTFTFASPPILQPVR
jgi:transcriptional regulator with XRE-family HTH domain